MRRPTKPPAGLQFLIKSGVGERDVPRRTTSGLSLTPLSGFDCGEPNKNSYFEIPHIEQLAGILSGREVLLCPSEAKQQIVQRAAACWRGSPVLARSYGLEG